MKPFKFFFTVALGVSLFFFLAKFVVGALIIASIMSLFYYLFQSMGQFFRRLDWEPRTRREMAYAPNGRSISYEQDPFFRTEARYTNRSANVIEIK